MLVNPQPGSRKGCLLSRVGSVPAVRDHRLLGVRGVGEYVVFSVGLAVLDLLDLLPDADQCITESVQLFLRLAFRRLDHQRVGDGERQRGGMEPKHNNDRLR